MEAGSVIDQHVQSPEAIDRLVHHARKQRHVQQIRLHQRHRVAPHGVQLSLQGSRFGRRRAVVQHEAGATSVQQTAGGRTHPARASCNQDDLVIHVGVT
jgi:hypothetical protein